MPVEVCEKPLVAHRTSFARDEQRSVVGSSLVQPRTRPPIGRSGELSVPEMEDLVVQKVGNYLGRGRGTLVPFRAVETKRHHRAVRGVTVVRTVLRRFVRNDDRGMSAERRAESAFVEANRPAGRILDHAYEPRRRRWRVDDVCSASMNVGRWTGEDVAVADELPLGIPPAHDAPPRRHLDRKTRWDGCAFDP